MITVGKLIEALSTLPEDAPVMEAWPGGIASLSTGRYQTFQVLDYDREVALYVVDWNASYPGLQEHWRPLLPPPEEKPF